MKQKLPDAEMQYLLKTEALRKEIIFHTEKANEARAKLNAIHEAKYGARTVEPSNKT